MNQISVHPPWQMSQLSHLIINHYGPQKSSVEIDLNLVRMVYIIIILYTPVSGLLSDLFTFLFFHWFFMVLLSASSLAFSIILCERVFAIAGSGFGIGFFWTPN